MSCIFFSLHMRVHMCIYKYYYLFICSIILKYCKYTCLTKYIYIYIYIYLYGSTDPEPELFLCPDGVYRLHCH